jgi:antitoxin Phd
MSHLWQLQEAKAKLSEVLKLAASEGPQVLNCRGVETAVILSMADYQRLEAAKPSFVAHLLSGPRLDDDLIAVLEERSKDLGREIEW